jgi:hypothetical protein
MEQKGLTKYQTDILKVIVENSTKEKKIEAISYYHPEKVIINGKKKNLLEKVIKGHSREETLEALGSLENFRVLSLKPNPKFGPGIGWYEVIDLKEAEKLYSSAK